MAGKLDAYPVPSPTLIATVQGSTLVAKASSGPSLTAVEGKTAVLRVRSLASPTTVVSPVVSILRPSVSSLRGVVIARPVSMVRETVVQSTLVKVSSDDTVAGDLEAKIVAGSNITLATLNPGANEQLEISATVPVTAKRLDYKFTLDGAVPNSGTAYLFTGLISTASVPLVAGAAFDFHGLTFKADTSDAANDYDLEVELNGVTAGARTLAIASGNDEVTGSITGSGVAGDDIGLRLNRTAGSGRSDFREVVVVLTLTES